MATYTITTTADQDTILSWATGLNNASLDLKLTNEEYIQSLVPLLLAPYATRYEEAVKMSILEQFSKAGPELQGQILILLNATPSTDPGTIVVGP